MRNYNVCHFLNVKREAPEDLDEELDGLIDDFVMDSGNLEGDTINDLFDVAARAPKSEDEERDGFQRAKRASVAAGIIGQGGQGGHAAHAPCVSFALGPRMDSFNSDGESDNGGVNLSTTRRSRALQRFSVAPGGAGPRSSLALGGLGGMMSMGLNMLGGKGQMSMGLVGRYGEACSQNLGMFGDRVDEECAPVVVRKSMGPVTVLQRVAPEEANSTAAALSPLKKKVVEDAKSRGMSRTSMRLEANVHAALTDVCGPAPALGGGAAVESSIAAGGAGVVGGAATAAAKAPSNFPKGGGSVTSANNINATVLAPPMSNTSSSAAATKKSEKKSGEENKQATVLRTGCYTHPTLQAALAAREAAGGGVAASGEEETSEDEMEGRILLVE